MIDNFVLLPPKKSYKIKVVLKSIKPGIPFTDWLKNEVDWMEEEIIYHKIKNKKKKTKRLSSYKQSKIVAHRTINGKGCVARLIKKNKIL